MSANSPSVVVVGGGVIGVCTAYYLAKRGCPVTLIERGSLDGSVASGSAGMIALAHPPLPRPGLTWKALKWMFDPGSPLYIPLRIDPSLFQWLWNFRRACTPKRFQQSMKVLAELGWITGKLWDQIVDEEEFDCEYRRTGWLDVFRTKAGQEHALHDAHMLRQFDYEAGELTGDELRERDPAFRPEVLGAIHYTDSRFLNPGKFVVQLAERVRELDGEILTEADVRQINVRNGRFSSIRLSDNREVSADVVVLAAGIWTTELAEQLGLRLPMQAGKGYHVMIPAPKVCPSFACVLNEQFVAATPMNNQLRLAGTVELSGINHRLVQRRLNMLTEAASKYLHGIEGAEIQSKWCGLRPCTADGLPVIGWAPKVEGVFIATGHAKYGLAYAPVTGKLVTESILGEKLSYDLSPMSADRFR